ncbi:actin-related protein 2/3 complex subunit 1A-like [Hibiscus syriacus]|uniref:actin-related protein 2/3 complex subunit 1A-like n=1 Tax=Hibiscus syriacus TaxID=106335 RepID=UPI001923A938|nr:actin-related protein 2/3 complex subunit 1A-like [Hibiscus syriacus]
MAAVAVHQFAQCITCHAWSPDQSMIAFCPNNNEVHIYKLLQDKWEKVHVLQKQILQLDLSSSWAFGVNWSPSGNTLAYVGHNSMIYFVDDVGPSPLAQNVAFRYLPLRDVLFVSEKMVIGVGFDCNPMVFAADKSGLWSFIRFLGERKESSSGPKYGSQISGAFGKLYGQSKQGLSNDTIEPSKIQGAAHDNCINCIELLKQKGPKTKRFSTSGMDGKVIIWDLENQQDLREYL